MGKIITTTVEFTCDTCGAGATTNRDVSHPMLWNVLSFGLYANGKGTHIHVTVCDECSSRLARFFASGIALDTDE